MAFLRVLWVDGCLKKFGEFFIEEFKEELL